MDVERLGSSLLPLLTTVAMERRSREDRLCQALTETLARGRLGLFLEAYFHAPYLLVSWRRQRESKREELRGGVPQRRRYTLIELHILALTPGFLAQPIEIHTAL